eukprot:TRINITY_DN2826_c0_g1_i2.p1 TRINITY_DN2826_c0_g1~~TRINITY_DN2826_c0_g1_i2.p1  ORF type:complete len:447 (-),score=134.98 TRINITY_DN2826_c0_g1_i2:472-1779(-)
MHKKLVRAETMPMPQERQLYGMDAEIHEKMMAKMDVERVGKALKWIGDLTGERIHQAEFYRSLRDGAILCRLLNSIKEGTVPKYNPKPNHHLVERENIQRYLDGCAKIGVPSHELFLISDLHEAKMLPSVLTNIYALARQAQVTPGFEGPILGPKYSVTLEDQQRRQEKKQKEAEEAYARAMHVERRKQGRVQELEREKKLEKLGSMKSSSERQLKRQFSKGRIEEKDFEQQIKEVEKKFESDVENVDDLEMEVGPIVFGMDLEHQKKMNAKLDDKEVHDKTDQILDWIEEVTGKEIIDLHADLKSGLYKDLSLARCYMLYAARCVVSVVVVVASSHRSVSGVILCTLWNQLWPQNSIRKIDMRAESGKRCAPSVARDNIKIYLNMCGSVLKSSELFSISDLYDAKNVIAVCAAWALRCFPRQTPLCRCLRTSPP